MRREGKAQGIALELEKPERVGHHWNPAEFNERERERSGGKREETTKGHGENYDVNETGVGGDQRGITAGIGGGKSRNRGSEARDPAVEEAFRQEQKAVDEAQRTVSELARLYRDVERLGELAQRQTPDLEPER